MPFSSVASRKRGILIPGKKGKGSIFQHDSLLDRQKSVLAENLAKPSRLGRSFAPHTQSPPRRNILHTICVKSKRANFAPKEQYLYQGEKDLPCCACGHQRTPSPPASASNTARTSNNTMLLRPKSREARSRHREAIRLSKKPPSVSSVSRSSNLDLQCVQESRLSDAHEGKHKVGSRC